MKSHFVLLAGAAGAVLLSGCATPLPPGTERGPHGTIAYQVHVEATPPGARIEVNGNVVGDAPIDIKVFGDRDGTFHDFGSYYYVIRALPVATNQFVQTRAFATGRSFTPEDSIPDRVYFDMNQNTPAYAPMTGPAYPYPTPYPYPGYYGSPYYPSPYYGPSVRFYFGPRGHYYPHYPHRGR